MLVAAIWLSAAIGSSDGNSVRVVTPRGVFRVDLWSPAIVRVRFSHDGKFRPDLVPTIVGTPVRTSFQVDRSPETVRISTSRLRLVVSEQDGSVQAFDRSGTQLIHTTGYPELNPVLIGGKATNRLSQRFKFADDEALYGLGQHQSGVLDYRGTRVVLAQRNMEVAIPLLQTSHGYGILWNNPSRGAFDAAQPLAPEQLCDENDKPGGLTGRYYAGRNLDKLVLTRTDPKVDFNWTTVRPPELPAENYSVSWTGSIVADVAGKYTFNTVSDDGVRLWIDGKKLIDDWNVHAAKEDVASPKFTAGSRHRIRLDYFQGTRDAIIQLPCAKPSIGYATWSSEAASALDYFLIDGPTADQVVQGYRALTGAAPLPPLWALGYWQSKERYATQQEWIDIAKGYRDRHLPIDNLVQDWFYWDPFPWGSHKFDPKRYPDPAEGIRTLHDDYHLHLMISVWGKFHPGVPGYPDPNFDTLEANHLLYPPNVSAPEQYYDAFNPKARALYWSQMKAALFDKGIDAWWLDASEPEVNLDALAVTPTHAGMGAEVMSAWPLMHTTGVYQGQRAATDAKRVFILTRSAYAGQQRNGAATWSGDITASWDTLARQIPAGLNFSLSGIPYWTTDIGAFFVNYPGGCDNPEYRELYTRWFEFGAFCPIFRSHGTSTPREMWRFGPAVEKTLLKYDRLRYRLMPYIYSEAWQITAHGGTMMRALPMDFPGDPAVRAITDEFMFGPSLLVCPVTSRGATSRPVILPKGVLWTDFWTGKRYRGGQTIKANAPIDVQPMFVKSGSIIPMGPEIEYTGQNKADPIELHVYPGADGHFDLYEDEGDGYGYEKGRRVVTQISWSEKRRELTFGEPKGSFTGMPGQRHFQVVLSSGPDGKGEEVSPPTHKKRVGQGGKTKP
jgi:alpha-D-xyloside xylohydrolase